MADLGRISELSPFITQLGAHTKITGFNNSAYDSCGEIAVDKYENIYCTGSTYGSMGKTTDGTQDAIVVKFDRSGKLLWVKQIASQGGNEMCGGIGVDDLGNVYCGGSTNRILGQGQVMVKNNLGQFVPRVATDTDEDIFVTKISPEGKVLWIKQFGSYGNDNCSNVAVSKSGNVYCGSRTTGEIGFDPVSGMYEYKHQTSQDPLIAKIDTNGVVVWIRQIGYRAAGTNSGLNDYCGGVAIDEEENVYCGGATPSNLGDTNGSGDDVLVWIVDKDGNTKHIKQLGVTADAHPEVVNVNALEQCYDVTVDRDQNFYCVAYVIGNLGENSGGGVDIALIKWDRNANLQWVTQLGNTTRIGTALNNGNEIPLGIGVSHDGNTIYVTAKTDADTVRVNYGPGASTDILLIGFDRDGNIKWGRQYGSSGNEDCIGIAIDATGNFYCAGNTNGNLGETSGGSEDIFILRTDSEGRLIYRPN